MTVLRIEHEINDLSVWLAAFHRFDDVRRKAGVVTQRIFQPEDDTGYIALDLEFESAEAAHGFRQFLETVVWASPDASPGLDGIPRARVLVPVGLDA